MALVPATITVLFTSNYTGDHRICWKDCLSMGPYDCTTIVTCLGGGMGCSTTISVTVDDATCENACFDGYVQAVCEDAGSMTGRVAWTTSYTPTNACEAITLTCTPGGAAFCDSFSIDSTTDCGGGTIAPAKIASGTEMTFCFPPGTVITSPTDYTQVPAATTCCSCLSYTITPTLGVGEYYYQDCITKAFVTATTAIPVTFCAIEGSVSVAYLSNLTISIGATCP